MCMQCMAGASVALGSAATTRAWLATRTWITPKALKRCTIALLTAALIAASLIPAATPAPQRTQATPPAAISLETTVAGDKG